MKRVTGALSRLIIRRCLSSAVPNHSLVVGNYAGPGLRSAVRAAQECVRDSGSSVDIILTGEGAKEESTAVARWSGVRKVFVAPCDAGLAEIVAPVVVKQIRASKYSHVLSPASSFGKDVMPRIAGILDVSPVSDITAVAADGNGEVFVRSIYAGNAIATVKSHDPIKVVTVRATAFDPVAEENDSADGGEAASIEFIDVSAEFQANTLSRWISDDKTKSSRPDLGNARVVVSGGRGLKSAENFKMLEQLADVLGGAVGATRAAVDSGMVPNDMQVGQTGKIVAPELYIAVGISGAIQHLAGMKDSKVIVAINKDPDAPIFQVADLGLIADLFQAVPELIERLTALKAEKAAQNK